MVKRMVHLELQGRLYAGRNHVDGQNGTEV